MKKLYESVDLDTLIWYILSGIVVVGAAVTCITLNL